MKPSLTIIPMCPRERFSLYKILSRLVLCYKKDWAILLHLIYFYYLLLVTNYLITKLSVPLISVLAENTLLKTAYHFLLLLVGFDTLTYRKDYDRSPILVGYHLTTSIFTHHTLTRAKAMRAPSMQADRMTTASRGQALTSHFTSPK